MQPLEGQGSSTAIPTCLVAVQIDMVESICLIGTTNDRHVIAQSYDKVVGTVHDPAADVCIIENHGDQGVIS